MSWKAPSDRSARMWLQILAFRFLHTQPWWTCYHFAESGLLFLSLSNVNYSALVLFRYSSVNYVLSASVLPSFTLLIFLFPPFTIPLTVSFCLCLSISPTSFLLFSFSRAFLRDTTLHFRNIVLRLAQHLGVLSTVALAGGYRQLAGGRWYWSHESGATQAEKNIHLSMMSALSIYTVLMRTNSPKQPGCLHCANIHSYDDRMLPCHNCACVLSLPPLTIISKS